MPLPRVSLVDEELVLYTIDVVIGPSSRSIIVWGPEEVDGLVEDQGMGGMNWRQA